MKGALTLGHKDNRQPYVRSDIEPLELVTQADEALYRAKSQGKNRVVMTA